MSKKILIVDDEQAQRQTLEEVFEWQVEAGEYELTLAQDGVEGLKILEAQEFDAVLLDLAMPRMQGLELLEEINSRHIRVRPIVISCHKQIENVRQSMNEGAFDFIPKPYDFRDLRQTVKNILEKPLRITPEKKAKEAKNMPPQGIKLVVKELDPEAQLGVIEEISESLPIEELTDKQLKDLIDSIKKINRKAREKQNSKSKSSEKPDVNAILEKYRNSFLESRYYKKSLADGTKKVYGPYYFLRWKDEKNRLKSLYLQSEHPYVQEYLQKQQQEEEVKNN